MAYDFFETSNESSNILTIDGPTVELPDVSYIRDAALERDGMDLILDGPQGTITVEGYFAAESAPDLTAEGGLVLTPKLVNSFVSSGDEYAQAATMNDASPVGAVNEMSGEATITRTDGTVETVSMGTPVFQGDVIETSGAGAVNITFIDDTSFAVSNNARLAIDEYVFDPATEAGTQNFSVLKGVFVFTSGLIGRDDPDDVNIDMPSGSIGIRGTIIAGNADSGEVTVVEGAIVVRDNNDNEVTLDERFETAKIDLELGEVRNLGQLDPNDVSARFDMVSNVSPTLFSSIDDAAAEEVVNPEAPKDEQPADNVDSSATEEKFDADGTVDGDNDSDVDGTVEESATDGDETGAVDQSLENVDGLEETAEQTLKEEAPLQNSLGNDPLQKDGTTIEAALKEAVQQDTMTAEQAKTVLSKTNTMNTEQKVALKNFLRDSQDPETIEPLPEDTGGIGGAIGLAPIYINDAQTASASGFGTGERFSQGQTDQPSNAFFRVGEGHSFTYDASAEFIDIGDTMTFTLSNPVDGSAGSVGSLNVSAAGVITFDLLAIGVDSTLDFDITATDLGGLSTTQTFTINLLSADVANTDGSDIPTALDTAEDRTFSVDTVVLGANGNYTVGNTFLNNGNDNLTIQNADFNTIHLGSGSNTVTVLEAAANTNNTIYGGNQTDTFTLNYTGATTAHFENTMYGLGGNDVFIMQTAGNMNFNGLTIKGGAGQDTLNLQGPTSILNFANINGGPFTAGDITGTAIQGIERLDLESGDIIMSLSTQNVFEFTDFRNQLRIDGDTGADSLTLVGFTDSGADSGAYDVYVGSQSGQIVTLLVDQDMTGQVTTI